MVIHSDWNRLSDIGDVSSSAAHISSFVRSENRQTVSVYHAGMKLKIGPVLTTLVHDRFVEKNDATVLHFYSIRKATHSSSSRNSSFFGEFRVLKQNVKNSEVVFLSEADVLKLRELRRSEDYFEFLDEEKSFKSCRRVEEARVKFLDDPALIELERALKHFLKFPPATFSLSSNSILHFSL